MQSTVAPSTLAVANFLSSILQETYGAIARAIGAAIGIPAQLSVGQSLEEFASGQAHVGFLCGLLYVRMAESPACPVEVVAAPVLAGERYRQQPIYYSDVVVRQASPYHSFDDLAGCAWAYNERVSHSGCNLVCYSLLERGKTPYYFGSTLKTGSHLNSLQAVIAGQADAAALDSHVLDALLRTDRSLASRIRTVAQLGPSSIPPVVVARSLDPLLKQQIQAVLVTMHQDPAVAQALQAGCIERFVPVTDQQYDDIRQMWRQVQAHTFPFV